MIRTWQKLFPWVNRQRVHLECRRCGTTVDAATDECPHCESTRIARYEIA
jgi:ribosomal protein L37E